MQKEIIKNVDVLVWAPLIESLNFQIDQVISGEIPSFSLTLFSQEFSPHPYAQGSLNSSGNLVLEVIGNSFLSTRLNDWEIQIVETLGWQSPSDDNPNFWTVVDKVQESEISSERILKTFQNVFRMKVDSWFTFGSSPSDLRISNSDAFWHSKTSNNVFCLPGRNVDFAKEGLHF